MKRQQSGQENRKKIYLFIFFSALIFAVLVECLGFNLKNIVKPSFNDAVSEISYVNFEKDQNGDLVSSNETAEINLKVSEAYIKNLTYNIELVNKGTEPITYSIMINGKDRLNTNTGPFSRQFGMKHKTVTINETTDTISFKFSHATGATLKVDDFKIANYFQFNFIRFFIVFILSIIALLIFFVKRLNMKIEVFSATVIVLVGLLLSFLVPPHHTWDEFAHFLKSYSVASGELFPNNETELTYPKEIDKINHPANLEYKSYDDFKNIKAEFSDINMKNTEKKNIRSTAIINLFVPYVPSGIGIKIAMLLQLPILYYLWFGRFMNVLCYALLVYFAIKKTPVGKRLMAFYAIIPINIFLAASLSCDFFAMGCLLLAIAITLDIVLNNKKVTIPSILMLLILYSFVTFAKVSYAPFFLLMFLIGKNQFSDKKNLAIYRVTVVISCAIVAIGTYYYASKLGIVQWANEGVSSSDQIAGIIKNPFGYVKMLAVFISDNSVNYIKNMFGFFAYVGDISQITVVMITGVMLFLAWFDLPNFSNTDKIETPLAIDRYGKIIIGLSSLGALFLSLSALYISFTTVGLSQVQGFQGRYLLPILFPVLLIFRNKQVHSPFKKDYLEKIAYVTILLITIPLFQAIVSYFYNS